MRSKYLLAALSALFLCLTSHVVIAQQSTGSVHGHLITPINARVNIQLIETSTRSTLLTTRTDTAGMFTFYDVPFGSYIALASQGSDTLATARVAVNSTVPVKVTLENRVVSVGSEILVTAATSQAAPALSHTFYPRSTIEKMPAPGEARKIESILLNTPGVVPDEDGRMHIRGEDAQLQYVIDGIPVTSNLTRVYSPLLNGNIIKTVDVLRGGLNAEYGVATAGVLAITSQSGIGKQFTGRAYQNIGSFGLSEQGAVIGGGLGENVGYFLAYNNYSSKRYLDPTSGFEPNHTDGHLGTIFGKFDFLLSDEIDAVLLGSYNDGGYSIPNALMEKDSAQDQRTDLLDYLFGARINWDVAPNAVLSILGYTKFNSASLRSGGLREVTDSASRAKAVRENEKFFIGADRENSAHGGQIEYSSRMNWGDNNHELKIGVGGETFPLKEFFTFGVTNPALSSADSLGGDPRLQQYDLNRNGTPFLVDQKKTGKRISAFVQDEVTLSDLWTLGLGVRYDMYDLFEKESGISPRVQAVYKASDVLSFRAAYNRLFIQAPLENILVSSSDQARALVGSEQGMVPTQVRSEKMHAFELGAMWAPADIIDLDISAYGKLIEDFFVKVELGSSGIIFPVNLKEGMVLGGELQARLHSWNNISGQIALATTFSVGLKPEDGSSPIAAGLILGEEGTNYNHPFEGEDMFPTEHNQLITSSWLFNYDDGGGYFFTFGGRFDSGLPFDIVGPNGAALPSEEATRAELKRRGYSDDVIDLLALEPEPEEPNSPDRSVAPHVTFDLGIGLDLKRFAGLPVKVHGMVTNVLDTPYLYKFESSFGGTHFGQPRTFVLTLEASY
jgi:outer membrane receptor protein involved in Fe transport